MSAVLKVSTVRQRFASALRALGYHESIYPYDRFVDTPDALQPRAFAVGAPRSDFTAFDGRDRFGTEGEAATVIGVRVATRITGDDQVGAYDTALDEEQIVIGACLDAELGRLDVRLESAEREVTEDGKFVVSGLLFLCHHRYSFGGA